MKRLLLVSALVGAMVLAAVAVVAQGPDEPKEQRLEGPGPDEGPPPPQHRRGPKFGHLDREYAKELRQAKQEIGELHRQLAENGERLHELWGQLKAAETPEAREALRPEFERVLTARSEMELQLAQRQVEIAQKGFDIALERLIEAKVGLNEAQIKEERRQRWFRGELGKHLRGRRHERLKEPEEQPEAEEKTEDEPPAESED